MRVFDFFVLGTVVAAATAWVVFTSKDGFKSSGLIVARSISVSSTINGSVVSERPAVGAKVKSDSLLVKIENGRIDKGRLVDLRSQIAYYQAEIENAERERANINELLRQFKDKAQIYSRWMVGDLKLQRTIKMREYEIAKKRNKLDTDKVKRTSSLSKKAIVSTVVLDIAKIKAGITQGQAEVSQAELDRIDLQVNSIRKTGSYFTNGETNYWTKIVDTLKLRLLDNEKQLATLKAQLERARSQVIVERHRIDSSYTEEHRAPVDGVVNAVFVGKGSRVVVGTPLLQVLDCTHPIAIAPIPQHRFGEFSIGQGVTVYPIDSKLALKGRIQYISSGPLLGQDKTLAVQQEVTLNGNKATISFDEKRVAMASDGSCDSTRPAVVVIHTNSVYDVIEQYVSRFIAEWNA